MGPWWRRGTSVRVAVASATSGRPRFVARAWRGPAEAWLRENLTEALTIRDLCAALHTSERTLHAAFREHVGTTPKAFVKAERLRRARQDLLHRRAQHPRHRRGPALVLPSLRLVRPRLSRALRRDAEPDPATRPAASRPGRGARRPPRSRPRRHGAGPGERLETPCIRPSPSCAASCACAIRRRRGASSCAPSSTGIATWSLSPSPAMARRRPSPSRHGSRSCTSRPASWPRTETCAGRWDPTCWSS